MLQDKLLMFSIDQAITGTADSTYYIDRDIIVNGEGKQLTVNVVVTKDFVGASLGLSVDLIKTDGTGSSGGTVVASSGEFGVADLKAGTRIPIHIKIPFINPDDANNDETNLILKYNVTGSGSFTAGKVTAGIEYRPQTNI